uniref:Uncharacterized protein n=1 Tax=Ascaris lumbricoides TaxID=6252 RepID=A0A9J2PD13_ASCLU
MTGLYFTMRIMSASSGDAHSAEGPQTGALASNGFALQHRIFGASRGRYHLLVGRKPLGNWKSKAAKRWDTAKGGPGCLSPPDDNGDGVNSRGQTLAEGRPFRAAGDLKK